MMGGVLITSLADIYSKNFLGRVAALPLPDIFIVWPLIRPGNEDRLSPQPAAHFEQVYADHYAEVLRFVTRRAHPLNVDDVVSETFIAAWQRRDVLPTPPLPWLYRTARN